MGIKLTSRQQQQLGYLQGLPMKFGTITRVMDQMAALQADDAAIRGMCRQLDEIKSGAGQLSLGGLADTAGHMVTLARRTGSQQMRVRGLRELMGSLKLNYDSALRQATTPERHDEPPAESGGGATS
ncbi:MAG: hypothetical protein ABJC74_11240 [Gemmatimonadota bacterium]